MPELFDPLTSITLTISTTNIRPKPSRNPASDMSEFPHIYRPMMFPGQDLFPQDILGRGEVSHKAGRKSSHTGYQSMAADVTHLLPHKEGGWRLLWALLFLFVSFISMMLVSFQWMPGKNSRESRRNLDSGQLTDFNCLQTPYELWTTGHLPLHSGPSWRHLGILSSAVCGCAFIP